MPPMLLRSMITQLFEQGQPGKPFQNFSTLLKHIQSADPNSPDFNEDNKGQGWGHYQFMAGGLNLLLTLWQDVGSIASAFQLVAAAIKTCWEAQVMCMNAGKSMVVGFISDTFLQETLDALKRCWIGAGGVSACFLQYLHAFTVLDYCLQVFSSHPTPFNPTYNCNVAKSPLHKLMVKCKQPSIPDVFSAPSADSTAHQQPTHHQHRMHAGAFD